MMPETMISPVEKKKTAMQLLMGGKSSRMGTSKAMLSYKGVPFWKHITEEMSHCGPVYLSVAKVPQTEEETETTPWSASVWEELKQYPLITDEVEAIGPMGGIYSALRQIKEDAVFVSACDMPRMNRAYIQYLLDTWNRISRTEDWDALMIRGAEGRIYTTAGIYHKCLLPAIHTRIQEGNYRMMVLLRQSKIYYIEETALGSLGNALTNVNTLEDYKNL